MASASIESTVTAPVAKPTVADASRDDLALTDVVEVNSVNTGTAYAWSLAYIPEGSSAAFSGSDIAQSPGDFTVDKEGPYLVRLALTVPTVTVGTAPLTVGDTLTIGGVPLTAVSGARTPGSDDFDGSLGTPALIAAEIVAALLDGANSFTGITTPTNTLGSAVVNVCPVVSGALAVVSSTTSMVVSLTSTTEQFVRLRALTLLGSLKLVAAGERVDTVPVPVDITITGWADEQNFNLLTLLGFVQTTETSGRAIFVDPVAGDYNTIQAAMDYAQTQTPSAATPWVVLVRPGTYDEDLTFYPFVHLFGWPGGQSTSAVLVRNATVAAHTVALPLSTDAITLSNLYFQQTAATANAALVVSGAGSAIIHKSVFVTDGAGTPQGAALQLSGTAAMSVFDSRISSNVGASGPSVALSIAGGAATLRNCRVLVRGVDVAEGATLLLRDCEVESSGDYALTSLSADLVVEYSRISGGTTDNVGVNPVGAGSAGAVAATFRWSKIDSLLFDTTAVGGATSLSWGATEHGTVTFPAGVPSTVVASTPSDTVFFDNTVTGLSAENVQDALDEIYTFAAAVRTLDDAYNSGDPGITGSGRRIIASAGAMQIVDASSPSDPIPPANTNGGLQVVGAIEVGALGKPEMKFDPNPFGNGPLLIMGHEIWANDAPSGSTALLLGNATGSPSYHNYNLTVGTQSADGGTSVGRVALRGGDSLLNPVAAGSVFVQAGRGSDGAGGDGGSVWMAPGDSVAGTGGAIFMVRPEDATAATLTAAGAFVGGVTGTIRFASDLGGVEVAVDAADVLGVVLGKFNATNLVTAVDSGGGVILLTTKSTGPNAEVFFLNADAGLDTALGGFSGQVMVQGTWPSYMEIQVSAHEEITFGPNAANPMIYNANTGKLTVPGIIDPIGLVLEEIAPLSTLAGKGVLFVGDGTSGSTIGHLYYRHEAGPLEDITAATSGSTTITVEDEGSGLGGFDTLNFTGSGVVASDAGGGKADITITAGGVLAIHDEGGLIKADTTLIDFVGAGVTASSTGPNSVQVSISGSALLNGVAQESFAASAFSAGPPSQVTLANTYDSAAALTGLITLFRNGKADMTRVAGVPTTADEYRVFGTTLQIGTNISGSSDTYLIAYPRL